MHKKHVAATNCEKHAEAFRTCQLLFILVSLRHGSYKTDKKWIFNEVTPLVRDCLERLRHGESSYYDNNQHNQPPCSRNQSTNYKTFDAAFRSAWKLKFGCGNDASLHPATTANVGRPPILNINSRF